MTVTYFYTSIFKVQSLHNRVIVLWTKLVWTAAFSSSNQKISVLGKCLFTVEMHTYLLKQCDTLNSIQHVETAVEMDHGEVSQSHEAILGFSRNLQQSNDSDEIIRTPLVFQVTSNWGAVSSFWVSADIPLRWPIPALFPWQQSLEKFNKEQSSSGTPAHCIFWQMYHQICLPVLS